MGAARLGIAFVAALLFAPQVAAQDGTLRGQLLLPDSATGASGVVIEAVLITDGAYRSRTLSGSRGDFRLRIPLAGRWRLTALRIGYQPVRLGEFQVGLREDVATARPFVLTGGALTLARLAVDSVQLCGHSDESGLLVATLLAQARAALAATLITPTDGKATAGWQRYEIFTDREGTPLTPLRVQQLTSGTDRPFGSVDPSRLARDGYFWERDDYRQFNAPDAEVLLSEQFVASHCYRTSPPHAEHVDWIGIAFAPAPGTRSRGTVGIEGTLWLDRTTSELRRLEFSYVGLRENLAAAGARGVIEFLRLPTDIWVVSAWELRLPRVATIVVQAGAVKWAEEQVNAMTITGGELGWVRRGEEELYRSWSNPADRVADVAARVGRAPVCKDAPPAGRPNGIVYGTVVDSMGGPVRASVRVSWISVRQPIDGNRYQERTSDAIDGFFMICDAEIRRKLEIRTLVGGEVAIDDLQMRLDGDRPWAFVPLRVNVSSGKEPEGSGAP